MGSEVQKGYAAYLKSLNSPSQKVRKNYDSQNENAQNANENANEEEQSAVFEKAVVLSKKAFYSKESIEKKRIDNVSDENKDKENLDTYSSIVKKTFLEQNDVVGRANRGNILWLGVDGGLMSSNSGKVSAKKDIEENGYYGVKNTSDRLFDFAKVLSKGDILKMKDMKDALNDSFDKAKEETGHDMAALSYDTLKRCNQIFENYIEKKENLGY